ncbi:MAG: PAS domain-containing protein [Streptosporangiales bacterium]|nr:PAS domain-containing protein [Streptosporangiales bacterium]
MTESQFGATVPDDGFQVAADLLPDGLVVADARGRVTVFNTAAAALTGVDRSAALGKQYDGLLPLRDDDGHDWWKCTDPYGGLPSRTRQPARLLRLGLDGPQLDVSARYVRSRRAGPLQQLVITLRDGASRARWERSRADLVSTVAHELRSPLTSVKGFTATLLTKWDKFTDEQRQAILRTVEYDADVLTRLIGDLLDVSRIESGRLELRRSVVDVGRLAHRLVAGRVAAGDDADRFEIAVHGELPDLWLDSDKVEQILANLVDNAVRHGDGKISIVVEPSAEVGDTGEAGVSVSVSDAGEGIPAELAPSVFTRFWRGNHRRGNTGLGLYIVKGLVEAHRGTIALGRSAAGGAMFRFSLPAGSPPYL